MSSRRCILSAIIFSLSMYPLYFIFISAASVISSLRLGAASSSSFSWGEISDRFAMLICGLAMRSKILHPSLSGVVPMLSRKAFTSLGFTGAFLQNSMILSIYSFFCIHQS